MKYELFLPRDKISFICDSVLSVVIQQKQFFGRIEVIDLFIDYCSISFLNAGTT